MIKPHRQLMVSLTLLLLLAVSCSQPTAKPTLAPSGPAAPDRLLPAPSPEAPTATSAVGFLAWPTVVPSGQMLRPDRSNLEAGQLLLVFANPDSAQDDLSIVSRPDPGVRVSGPCRVAVTVRGIAGFSCPNSTGATIIWVERGWRYQLGGGLLTTAQALALAETLEFVTPEVAAQRLSV